jgi:hypothetical protein
MIDPNKLALNVIFIPTKEQSAPSPFKTGPWMLRSLDTGKGKVGTMTWCEGRASLEVTQMRKQMKRWLRGKP